MTRKLTDNTLSLSGYRGAGDVQPFVIPAQINGMAVTEIASSFTTNIPCGKLTANTLVLPNTLSSIKDNAFKNSAFSEIYFFDNVKSIGDEAFPYNLITYHINAYEAPCYLADNNSVSYADSIDRLIVNADKRKMILFSGCSFAYGVNSKVLDEAYNGKYVVCNMGVNGDINGAFQMECILAYLGEGDVLIHAPEQMSAAQLMSTFYLDNRMFIMAEGNYDILSIPNFANVDFFKAFMHYSEMKEDLKSCSYTDGCRAHFNEYGDFILERPYKENTEKERDVSYSNYGYGYALEMLTESSVAKLASYYDCAQKKGATVCISYAPMNQNAKADSQELFTRGREFDEKFRMLLMPYGYVPISSVNDYIFLGRYFYDSDYHMNEYGALLRTYQLIEDLTSAGIV